MPKKKLEEQLEEEDNFEEEIDELELDEDEDLEGIEEDKEDIESAKELRKISASDPSGPLKRALANRPVPQKETAPVLEQMMETNSEQNLEMQLQEAQMPENKDEDELDYSGQEKKDERIYGEGKKLQGTYDPHTRTTRFDESKASTFDSDKPREAVYSANMSDGTQEKGLKNEYEIRGANMKIKRFDHDNARTFDTDVPREYEFE